MGIDPSCLGPDAQRQVREQLERGAKQQKRRKQLLVTDSPDFDSQNERNFWLSEVYPGQRSGKILTWELHRTFELFPALEYGGVKYRRIVFTPDFYIEYTNGDIGVVEVKGTTVRRLQPDYPLRRRIFLEKIAIPNGWFYREILIPD